MKPGKIKVGLVQTTVEDDKAKHVQKTLERVREAAARGAKLICLQELFASQYFCQTEDAALFDLAEPIPGPDRAAHRARSPKSAGVVVVAPLFEKRAPGVYHNTAVVLDADGEHARAVSQDAHPRRPAVLREVLLHARRPRLSRRFDTERERSARWSAGTSGTRRPRA